MHWAGMGESFDRTTTYLCRGAPVEPTLGRSGAVKYGISVIGKMLSMTLITTNRNSLR